MPRAYISSTFRDLQQHRQIANLVVKRFGYEDVTMEYYVAEDERPLDRCLADVAACDLYIGIFAWRYGYVPEGEQFSITELEYRRAVEKKKPRLLFVIDEEAEWPMKFVDVDRTKVTAFHERLRKDRVVSAFSTPDTLEGRLSAALEQRSGTALRAKGIDVPAYVKFLRRRYNILNLDALTDPKRDELLQLKVQSVFVEQSVREDPPPLELPKETWQMLVSREDVNTEDLPEGVTEEILRDLKSSYVTKPAKPVLEVLASPDVSRAIILGDPGSGKSTLLRFLTLSSLDTGDRLPFLIDLKAYTALRGQKRCETFFEYFDIRAKEEDCPASGDAVKRYLEDEQPATVMFDGIDEIFDPIEQETITRQIIAVSDAYPTSRIIVTSRIIGYRRALLTQAGFRHYTLQDLDADQVKAFVSQWYTLTLGNNPAEARARVDRIEQSFDASPSIRQLAGNPMLLTIMAIIGKHQELPRERWKLYDHATSVLVQHWDVGKHLADKKLGTDLMDEEDKKELLRRLAYAMQRGKGGLAGNYIHATELQAEFEAYLHERYAMPPERSKMIARAMIAQFRERNFILSFYGANLYGFVHRAFLEFFCADAIRTKFEKTKELPLEALKTEVFGAHWQEKAWQEVLRLICGMVGEEFVGELIEYLRGMRWEKTKGANIKLAIECLGEIRRIELVGEPAAGLLETVLERMGRAPYPSVSSMLDAARVIGDRWPGRDLLADWISGANFSATLPHEQYMIGFTLGTIAKGLTTVKNTLIKRLQTLDQSEPVAGILLAMLARGWRDHEVDNLLFSMSTDASQRRVMEWIAVFDRRDDPRALPLLLTAEKSVLKDMAIKSLEAHIARQDGPKRLRELARSQDAKIRASYRYPQTLRCSKTETPQKEISAPYARTAGTWPPPATQSAARARATTRGSPRCRATSARHPATRRSEVSRWSFLPK